MSGVEVTDDDLSKLEEELRSERAPSRRSQDSNASIEPVAADQVIASEIAENVVNNNSSTSAGGNNGNDANNCLNSDGNISKSAPGSGTQHAIDNPFIVPTTAVASITTTGTLDGYSVNIRTNHTKDNHERVTMAEERRQAASAEDMLTIDVGGDERLRQSQQMELPHRQMVPAVMAGQNRDECHPGSGESAETQPLSLLDQDAQEASSQDRNDLEGSEPRVGGGRGGECGVMSPSEAQLGKVRPLWIQDEDAPICMNCGQDFTMFRRRHHCRACGKVLCSNCCKDRARLQFMEGELARVCSYCIEILNKVERWSSPSFRPDPSNPLEYCSTVSPLAQMSSTAQLPPPTVMVPVGVLKKVGEKSAASGSGLSGSVSSAGGSGSKSVVFSDGIRPGGDLTDLDIPSTPPAQRAPQRTLKQVTTPGRSKGSVPRKFRAYTASDSLGSLPNVLLSKEFTSYEQPMTVGTLFNLLQDSSLPPVAFGLTRHNIQVMAKVVDLECCVGIRVWSFCSQGLAAFGQDEVALVLQWHQDDELAIPRDVFKLYRVLFENAGKAAVVSAMDHLLFPGGLLGSSEHTGFLFVRRTLQCSERLVTPNPLRESTYLVALLVLKTEVPWAKLFPLRLLLRLGAEFRYYPCPLVSVRFRKPVYFLEHQSILTILADFTNYQYTIQNIPGLVIHTVGKKTTILAPRNRYELMMKASTTNENILALGANFSLKADSHLVCTQSDDGSFQSQTFNSASTQISVRGASFVVFSGALKSNSGFTARGSVVEDGLLVQVSPIDMSQLKQAIHDMRDYRIICKQTLPSNFSGSKKVTTGGDSAASPAEVGDSNAVSQEEEGEEEYVELVWAANESTRNEGATSALDGASLAGVPSCRMFSGTDFSNDRFIVRWTEVFFLASKDTELDLPDPNRLIDATGRSMCIALLPHAAKLISLDPEQFGYEIGAGGAALAPEFLGEVDNALVPIITSLDGSHQPMTIELIFYVLLK
ncbi:zinc finger FYVE domain-containing protein 9-like isoform X3 [Varroa destructor]|uniref:FYVE-type domain-containing protein n=1 Tax=Varroa destructor TaxID=109461 RepID=A0A7M7MFW3_VARDE|nr:zinc finger FYVE domain-containing protein 9-like isoform X3 [Varroa destructor]